MTNYKQTMADALEFMNIMREYRILERDLTGTEKKRREEIAQDMDDGDFKSRYGDRWKEVKMATATKQAKKESGDGPLSTVDEAAYYMPKGRELKALKKLLSQPTIPIGDMDGDNNILAKGQLPIGDKELDKELEDLYDKKGSKGDAKSIIRKAMKRLGIKEETLGEGTWQMPVGPKGRAGLKKLMKKPVKAKDAIDAIDPYIGDDELFDDLGELDDDDPNQDVRPTIKAAMKRLGIKEDIGEAVAEVLSRQVNEKIVRDQTYFKSYSDAVAHALKYTKDRGYEVDEDDFHNKVTTGPRKPSEGKTVSQRIDVTKGGKPQKKQLSFQVYNKGGKNPYELNVYVEEVDLNEDNMDLMRKAAKGAMQTIKFKDGKLKMDSFTASGIMQIYDKVNPKNKAAMEKMINSGTKAQIMKLQSFAMKKAKEEVEEDFTHYPGQVDPKKDKSDGAFVRGDPTEPIEFDGKDTKSVLDKANKEVEKERGIKVKGFIEEKFTKKDFDDNEDNNEHTLNAVELVKMFGDNYEKRQIAQIKKDHDKNRHIVMKDRKVRDALLKKYHPKLKEEVEIGEKFDVKTAASKKGKISVSSFDSLDDAKKHLAAMEKKGQKGIISKDGKPIKEEVELDEIKFSGAPPQPFLWGIKDGQFGGRLKRYYPTLQKMHDDDMKKDGVNYLKKFNGDRTAYIRDLIKRGIDEPLPKVAQKEIEKIIKNVSTKPKKEEVELEEATENDILNALKKEKIGGYFSGGKLYVAQRALETVRDLLRGMKLKSMPSLVGEHKGTKPHKHPHEDELDESGMGDLHQHIKDGKSAKEISKLMKVDVKTIEKLMKGFNEKVDPADVDDDATDDDVIAASKNIMMQLRKAVSLRGKFKVEFGDKKKKEVPARIAQEVQKKYNSLRRPADKEEFQTKIAKSYDSMLKALKENAIKEKTSQDRIVGLVSDKLREKKHG